VPPAFRALRSVDSADCLDVAEDRFGSDLAFGIGLPALCSGEAVEHLSFEHGRIGTAGAVACEQLRGPGVGDTISIAPSFKVSIPASMRSRTPRRS